jgi:hypothetical protein
MKHQDGSAKNNSLAAFGSQHARQLAKVDARINTCEAKRGALLSLGRAIDWRSLFHFDIDGSFLKRDTQRAVNVAFANRATLRLVLTHRPETIRAAAPDLELDGRHRQETADGRQYRCAPISKARHNSSAPSHCGAAGFTTHLGKAALRPSYAAFFDIEFAQLTAEEQAALNRKLIALQQIRVCGE